MNSPRVLPLIMEGVFSSSSSSSASSSHIRLGQLSRPGAWTTTPLIQSRQLGRITHPKLRPFHTTPVSRKHFQPSPPKPPSTSPSSPSGSLPERFRSLMRLTPHSVVVCTSSHSGVPRAMTMSSFASLSLSPPAPTISFNIAAPSRTLDAVEASRRFNIHILSDDPRGARVADWLARGNAEGRGSVFERLSEESGCEAQVDGESVTLKGEGVLYVLRCKLLDEEPNRGLVKVRDHVVCFGEVVEIIKGSGSGGGDGMDQFGLVYADRTYRRLGECIIPGRIIDAEEEGQEG